MKRLYVGCRVRVVNDPEGDQEMKGREGVVIAIEVATYDWDKTPVRGVKVDLGDIICRAPYWAVRPIQDPGHQVVEWSECLWQPEGITA